MFGNNLATIAKLGQKGKADKILKYVNSKSSDERGAAATALGNTSGDDAYNALVTLLRDPVISVRICAAGALKSMGRVMAIEHLRNAAKNTTDIAFMKACNGAAVSLVKNDKL